MCHQPYCFVLHCGFAELRYFVKFVLCSDKCASMNSLAVYKIEAAILENAEIIKLCGNSKYESHAAVSDNTGNNNRP